MLIKIKCKITDVLESAKQEHHTAKDYEDLDQFHYRITSLKSIFLNIY